MMRKGKGPEDAEERFCSSEVFVYDKKKLGKGGGCNKRKKAEEIE